MSTLMVASKMQLLREMPGRQKDVFAHRVAEVRRQQAEGEAAVAGGGRDTTDQ